MGNAEDPGRQSFERCMRLFTGHGLRAAPAATTDRPADGPAEEPSEHQVSVCRPELFFFEDLAGLLEPTLRIENGIPQPCWMHCLQDADGHRSIQPFAGHIQRPGGGVLVCRVQPGSPSALPIAWSTRGRQRWLQGETPDAATLFTALREHTLRYVVLPEPTVEPLLDLLALWMVLTYCYLAWPTVPYLRLEGTVGSGKTRLLEVLGRLVRRPLYTSSITAAALIRVLDQQGVTLLLDEAEELHGRSESKQELRTALLAGYKAGGKLLRAEQGEGAFEAVSYDVFGPKAIAGIGSVPPSLASRCLTLHLTRAPADAAQVRRSLDDEPLRWQALRDDLHAFVLTHAARILSSRRGQAEALQGMTGRERELWSPLFDLAAMFEAAGIAGLVARLRHLADDMREELEPDRVPSTDTILLDVLREAVVQQTQDLTPKELLDRARHRESRLFRSWSPHRVAGILRQYGLTTRKTAGGRRSYLNVTTDMLERVARLYGLEW